MKIKKADLIAAMEAKRPAVAEFDRQQLAAHREHVKNAAAKRRAWARKLVKMTDRQLGELNIARYDVPEDVKFPEGASCPLARTPQLDAAIRNARMDMRQTFTIDMFSRHDPFGMWLKFGEQHESTVC